MLLGAHGGHQRCQISRWRLQGRVLSKPVVLEEGPAAQRETPSWIPKPNVIVGSMDQGAAILQNKVLGVAAGSGNPEVKYNTVSQNHNEQDDPGAQGSTEDVQATGSLNDITEELPKGLLEGQWRRRGPDSGQGGVLATFVPEMLGKYGAQNSAEKRSLLGLLQLSEHRLRRDTEAARARRRQVDPARLVHRELALSS